jgi:hypothetical protein
VYPIVGYVTGDLVDVGSLEKNDDEVELVFSLSLQYLSNPENMQLQEFKRVRIIVRLTIPRVEL